MIEAYNFNEFKLVEDHNRYLIPKGEIKGCYMDLWNLPIRYIMLLPQK